MTKMAENWEITDIGDWVESTFTPLLLRSRKGGYLYRSYRGMRKMGDNHLSNPPPENQVGDLLESCMADNLSNYSGSIVYVCLYFSIP